MNARWVLALAALAAGAAGGASAQEVIFHDPHVPAARVGAGQYVLTPVDTPIVADTPLFLDETRVRGRAPLGYPPALREVTVDGAPVVRGPQIGGAVDGHAVFEAGALPAVFPAGLRVDIGFLYMRPDFPGRSVKLTVPSGVNGNFSTIAGSGDVSFDFGFIPAIRVDYQFPDLGYGVSASGKLTTLSGSLTRTIDSAAGSANLTASSTISFATANLIEGTLLLPLGRCDCFQDSCLRDTVLLATLGTRYSHLSQDYTASLNSGPNASTLTAHQDWDGFGLTTSLSFLHPLPNYFFLYGVSRGSFMVGKNNRTSTLAVVVSGNAAASTATKVHEDKTEFIPVGEFEFGVAWGKPLAGPPAGVVREVKTGPVLWLKAGVVADIWGGLGILSAPDNVQGFSGGGSLFLFGFSVLAGVDY